MLLLHFVDLLCFNYLLEARLVISPISLHFSTQKYHTSDGNCLYYLGKTHLPFKVSLDLCDKALIIVDIVKNRKTSVSTLADVWENVQS